MTVSFSDGSTLRRLTPQAKIPGRTARSEASDSHSMQITCSWTSKLRQVRLASQSTKPRLLKKRRGLLSEPATALPITWPQQRRAQTATRALLGKWLSDRAIPCGTSGTDRHARAQQGHPRATVLRNPECSRWGTPTSVPLPLQPYATPSRVRSCVARRPLFDPPNPPFPTNRVNPQIPVARPL
ncbi:hypothetical protein MRX96_037678 [Rhipicephalus microplus]